MYQSIPDSLDSFEWSLGSTGQIYDSVDRIVDRFRFQASFRRICKRHCK